jgi:hypothetical protein
MTGFRKAILFALIIVTIASSPCLAQATAKKFTIYEFVPYRDHVEGNNLSPVPPLSQYLESLGIHPIKVIYEKRFMTDSKPDAEKIEEIAKSAISSPGIPVSFDTEFGDRFNPETVIPRVSEILDIYHRYNTVTPAGVYATAPQNTYAWKPDINHFDALNRSYAPIAHQVDFLSPVLYNYEGADTEAWKKAAIYNIAAAKQYQTSKPIFPYIGVVIHLQSSSPDDSGQHGPVRTLTEAEMLTRLQTLYDLGADGCIVWASSGDRTTDGKMPVFDRNSGWGKALAEFARAHQ